MLFVGDCTHGSVGSGSSTINKDLISLGLLGGLPFDGHVPSKEILYPVYQRTLPERFRAPIIRQKERPGHRMVPE